LAGVNGLTRQIDTAGGVVKLNKLLVRRITFEISNSRVLFSLPTEEFPKLLAQLEKSKGGEKEEE